MTEVVGYHPSVAEVGKVGTEAKPSRLSKSSELISLLRDSSFQERFIKTQTQPEQQAVISLDSEIEQRAKKRANTELEAETSRRLGIPLDEAKKLGKDWGMKLREVKGEVVGEQIMEGGRARPVTREESLVNKLKTEESQNPEYIETKARALLALREGGKKQKEVLDRLLREAENRFNDPELLEALNIWGRSPDSQGNLGEDEQGFNAGVIHYFEYRADPIKNGRYKGEQTPVGIDGFIGYSMRIKALMENPDPATNPDIQSAAMLKDSAGQHRLYMLTKNGELIVGFRRSDEEGSIKVITVMPGQVEKDFRKRVQDEKDGTVGLETGGKNRASTSEENLQVESAKERLAKALRISETDEAKWLETQPEELKAVGRHSFENIRRFVDLFATRLAEDHQLTPEQIQDLITREVARIKDQVFISVNMSSERALRFAQRGEYKSFLTFPEEKQIEIAARQNLNGDIGGYIIRRKNVETSLRYGDLPEGAVSACLASPNGHSEIRGGADLFGDVVLILDREKIAPRVIYTLGDSMNPSAVENILGDGFVRDREKHMIDRQLIFDHAVIAESILNIFRPLVIQGSAHRFVEALIYGGFTVDEVEEVRVPSADELLRHHSDRILYKRYAQQVNKLRRTFKRKVKIVEGQDDE